MANKEKSDKLKAYEAKLFPTLGENKNEKLEALERAQKGEIKKVKKEVTESKGKELVTVKKGGILPIVKEGEERLPAKASQFTKTYSLRAIQKHFRKVKTVQQALGVDSPRIAELKGKYGEVITTAYIKLWIIELNELLNVTRPLTEYQIDICAELIIEEFYNLSIVDINLIFRKAKLGEYGELYGSLSMDKILRWFRDYYELRLTASEDMTIKKHEKLKYHQTQGARISEDYKEKTRAANKKYQIEKIKEDKIKQDHIKAQEEKIKSQEGKNKLEGKKDIKQ